MRREESIEKQTFQGTMEECRGRGRPVTAVRWVGGSLAVASNEAKDREGWWALLKTTAVPVGTIWQQRDYFIFLFLSDFKWLFISHLEWIVPNMVLVFWILHSFDSITNTVTSFSKICYYVSLMSYRVSQKERVRTSGNFSGTKMN